MNDFYDRLLNKKVSLKDNTIWYTAGCLCSSASSFLLLLLVTRTLGAFEGGVFAIGWTICQLLLTVGRFGTRNYQVTDIKKEFSFSDYFSSKVLYIVFMLIGCAIYAYLLRLNAYKTQIAFLLTFFVIPEVLADAFAGNFQFHNKLHISGKSTVVRTSVSDLLFLGLLLVGGKLNISILAATVYGLLWLYFFDYKLTIRSGEKIWRFDIKKIMRLTYVCFPICASAFFTNLIISIPKNAIELVLNEEIQAIYGVIFMPSSVINMLGMFVFLPLYGRIALFWNEHNLHQFKRIVFQNITYIIFLTVIVMAGGYLLGIEVLSFIYNIDLTNYKLSLMILLLAGGMNCFVVLVNYLITVMRKQKFMLFIYIFVSIVMQLLAVPVTKQFNVEGAATLYLVSISFIAFLLLLVFIGSYKKER